MAVLKALDLIHSFCNIGIDGIYDINDSQYFENDFIPDLVKALLEEDDLPEGVVFEKIREVSSHRNGGGDSALPIDEMADWLSNPEG